MKKCIVFSPEFPVDGIASWAKNLKEYLKEMAICDVIHVDESIRLKNATNMSLLVRILKYIIKNKIDVVHAHVGAIKYVFLSSMYKKNNLLFG